MGKITRLGGTFIRAKDSKSPADCHQQNLDIYLSGNSCVDLPVTGTDLKLIPDSMFSLFSRIKPRFLIHVRKSYDQFEGRKPVRIAGGIKKQRVELIGEPVDEEYGKFAWIMDPEGNKIELWKPPVSK